MYRSAASTLSSRCRRELLANVTWYKKRKREEGEEEGEEEGGDRYGRRKIQKKENGEKAQPVSNQPAKAVMFTPYTTQSILAKRMREAEEKLLSLTGYKIKIVERAGSSLEDLLHRADPWQGRDCGRENCLLCTTKNNTGKNLTLDCIRRSLCYEIWCRKCEKDGEWEIKREENDEKKKETLKKEMKLHKYIGETSRSRNCQHIGRSSNRTCCGR